MSSVPAAVPWRSRVLPRYLRWYFASQGLNSAFAMITFGSSVFVLYLADLGLDKARIGLMLSLFPFAGLIAPFISGWVSRFGFKRTYLAGYGTRKFVMLLMVAAPWVLQRFGSGALFGYAACVIAVFALLRATAETAYYPWNREFIPDAIRGRVAGTGSVIAGTCTVAAMLLASIVLRAGTGLARYQVLIGGACVIGIVSVFMMLPVPGGKPAQSGSSGELWRAMRRALADRRYVMFLLGVGCSAQAIVAYAFLPLFARERLLIPESQVVLFDVATMLGSLVSSLYWGWAADHYGGKPLTLSTLALTGVLPWVWLLLPAGNPLVLAAGLALSLVYGAASGGLSIGSFRWFLNDIVPMEQRTAYTSLWYAWSGLMSGIAPFLGGWLLRALGGLDARVGPFRVHAFTVLFAATLVLTALGVLVHHRVPAPSDARARDYLRAVVTHDLPGALRRLLKRR